VVIWSPNDSDIKFGAVAGEYGYYFFYFDSVFIYLFYFILFIYLFYLFIYLFYAYMFNRVCYFVVFSFLLIYSEQSSIFVLIKNFF